MKTDVPTAQEEFRRHTSAYWSEIHDGDAKRASAHTAANNKLVKAWAAAGRVEELLAPLMRDTDSKIRLAAASYLLNYVDKGEAVAVLEDLRDNDPGMASPTARMRLHLWRRAHLARGEAPPPLYPSRDIRER